MLLSNLTFGTFLAYTPRPETPKQNISKTWMYALKFDSIAPGSDPPQQTSKHLVNKLIEYLQETPLKDFFNPSATLIPMPSSVLLKPHSLWVPERIARAMVEVGLGNEVAVLLKRTNPIQKSAYSALQNRPRPRPLDHYNTLAVNPLLINSKHIFIIDDIITRGASMIGAASLLAESYPTVKIAGFGMIRTLFNCSDFASTVDPRVGLITCADNWTHREP